MIDTGSPSLHSREDDHGGTDLSAAKLMMFRDVVDDADAEYDVIIKIHPNHFSLFVSVWYVGIPHRKKDALPGATDADTARYRRCCPTGARPVAHNIELKDGTYREHRLTSKFLIKATRS